MSEDGWVLFEESERDYGEHSKSDELPEILCVHYSRNLFERSPEDKSIDDKSKAMKSLKRDFKLYVPGEEWLSSFECMDFLEFLQIFSLRWKNSYLFSDF